MAMYGTPKSLAKAQERYLVQHAHDNLRPVNWNSSGVYMLQSQTSGWAYVGKAQKILRRVRFHFQKLGHNDHENRFLQAAFDQYGRADFNVILLENCAIQTLRCRESFWISQVPKEFRLNILDPNRAPKIQRRRLYSARITSK